MKKLVALVLVLMLTLGCGSALALDAAEIFGAFDTENSGSWGPPYDHSVWKKLVGFNLLQNAAITAKVYDEEGNLFNTLMDDTAQNAGYVVIDWPAVDVNGWHPDSVPVTFKLEVTAEVNGENVTHTLFFPFNYVHGIQDHVEADWYPHNTICVAGIEFRDAKPELTSKWYNFAAIDLSQDGVQVFDLVASNLYVIGQVIVTKTGDEVVVDWALNLQGTADANFVLEDEFLTFFSSLDAVTEVEPELFDGPTYEFGQPISIANDLQGDTNVLLYICNQATYCTNLSYKYLAPIYHPRYDANAYSELRLAMETLMAEDAIR